MNIVDRESWDQFFHQCPGAHLLQSSTWADLKSSFGWSVSWLITHDIGTQILIRKLPLGFSIAYIPKGPIVRNMLSNDPRNNMDALFSQDIWNDFQRQLDVFCKSKKVVFLKIEPDLYGLGEMTHVIPKGYQSSPHSIQPVRTVLIDLEGDDSTILSRMKPKTRYNIHLARRKGVQVFPSADIHEFYTMMEITGQRDHFPVHSLQYYQKIYELFHESGDCELFLASYESTPLAGLMVFSQGSRTWYFYGASNNRKREFMPTYLLQWQAIQWAKNKGCTIYDLWGIPDAPDEILERDFANRSDGLWGVYRFKRGFGGQVVRAAGPWDRVYKPLLYRLYLFLMEKRSTLN